MKMAELTCTDILNYVKMNQMEEFTKNILIFLNDGNIVEVVNKCDEDELKLLVDWSTEINCFIIHRMFEKVKDLKSISFLKTFTYYSQLDSEKRTLLHVAVIHDRNIEILKFLIEVKGINILSEDDYSYTPLHYYCQKEEYDSNVLKLLIKNPHQLTKQTKDGLTPLEFACSNHENLQKIREIKFIDMKELLRNIDDIANGVTEFGRYSLTKSFPTDRIWLNLLQKNDKYMLLSYIKNDKDFIDKYYMEPSAILSIIKKCPENGQGILSFIKVRFFKGTSDPKLFRILSDLTGITVSERQKKRTFYKSALFLALLTGRFQLISPLLRCCQFEIVSYSMLICLICKNFIVKNSFPDQVIKDIENLKTFCEEYSIAVMNNIYHKDLSENKTVIGSYINRESETLDSKSIVEIAYHAKCEKYLCLPICQESLTQVWTELSYKCPRIKFWLHSITHVGFLILLSYVVANNLFAKMKLDEGVCYAYGFGYFVEEIRQIYMMTKNDFFTTYAADPTNLIDIFALIFMFIGFILRVSLDNPVSREVGLHKLFTESKHTNLFVQRLFLCLSLIAFFMRVLYFASLNETLGPKLKMISKMITKDLIPTLFLFNIFVVSFGVTFQSLLFPNGFYVLELATGPNGTITRKGPVTTLSDIFRRATFTIFNFQYTLNDVEVTQSTYVTDSNGRYAVYFLLLIFMVVVNVMLMNLLIAEFSNTVNTIILQSKQSWKRSRYGFIHEYSDRTIASPPFNIIMITIEVLIRIIRRQMTKASKTFFVSDEEDAGINLVPVDNESPEEPSMSFYIYQAFALKGKRYRLLKDEKDIEYEKEVLLKSIDERLKTDKTDIKRTINERCNCLETTIKSQLIKRSHKNISSSVFYD